uniref:Uncharacterized protein n=1 Tax=Mycena chlorophos TaxID=658473 RepID=A0ABQ0LID3_MYCCL|nr:predicted protein [Mycena chlorophos]
MTTPVPFTFLKAKLEDCEVVAPDGVVYYEISTTRGFLGHKITTIKSVGNVSGAINWREKTFTLNGMERKWKDLEHREAGFLGLFKSERNWNWNERPYNLKYHDSHKELLVTPKFPGGEMVRFTTYQHHLLHENARAVIYFPQNMDLSERMFLLMAVIEMEFTRQEEEREERREAFQEGLGA